MRIVFAIWVAFSLSVSAGAQVGNKRLNDTSATDATQASVRPVPIEISRRSESLHAALEPSARVWMQQQAQIEARRPALDLDSLRAAIRRRFAGSQPGQTSTMQNLDVDAVVFMVLTEAAQNQQQDLQRQMQQMQAMQKEKQALRQLLDQMQREIAQAKPGERSSVCQTAFCRSLPSKLAEMTSAGANAPRPFHLSAQDNITYPQLSSLASQTDQALGSVGDMSQEQQLQIQTAMDKYSKAMETLSNILKTLSDTSTSVIANMK